VSVVALASASYDGLGPGLGYIIGVLFVVAFLVVAAIVAGMIALGIYLIRRGRKERAQW
jgi:hypothetical protein